MLTQKAHDAELIAIADPELLLSRADALELPLHLKPFHADAAIRPQQAGELHIHPVELQAPCQAGVLNTANADYVLETLRIATDGCMDGRWQALVTAPLHKGVINDAGTPFSGHTEFLAERSGGHHPVMMLACPGLRVALATTHLPLSAVSAAISKDTLRTVLGILDRDLRERFAIENPRILVCGLNPHAGEGGHMGREEIDIIEPVLNELRRQGMNLSPPMPADTLFTPRHLQGADAVLAMYHDQGLPVLKHMGFGNAVNITLGLPIIRTSVDHGTALDLAGSGTADVGSLEAAVQEAIHLSRSSR